MLSLPSLVVIVAAYNEEEGISATLSEVAESLNNPLCLTVDGNSTDRTVEVAKEMGAEVLLQKGSGKGSAISQALEHVYNNPKYVAFIDADFTYPAKYVSDMIKILEEKPSVGMVLGNRINHMLRHDAMKTPFHFGNRLLALAQHLLNGVKLIDPLTGLRVVRWEILKGWKPTSKGFDIEAEMNFYVERQGYQITELLIPYRERLGKKKLGVKHALPILKRIIVDGVRTKFSSNITKKQSISRLN